MRARYLAVLLTVALFSAVGCGPPGGNGSTPTATSSPEPTLAWVKLGSVDMPYTEAGWGPVGPHAFDSGSVRVVALVTDGDGADGMLSFTFVPKMQGGTYSSPPPTPPPGYSWTVTGNGTYEQVCHIPAGWYTVSVSKDPGFAALVTVYEELPP